ncbi:hypothetical protein Pmani_004183 [Petrolisthes manimaculis]|uniref:Uncharacterized protein n=1 Tax=Petrolisthes manimaculis TaxID=1843537 RepID=A0AAE1QE64_9EUCA|nr:hypothetical protein Pmani_004183 [Petrolisthes manimaculis]
MRKMLTEYAGTPQPQEEAKSEVEVKVFEESPNYKTYLVKLDKHFGFSITTFKEEKDASLVREDVRKETKVVFFVVDITCSMNYIIYDINKQISTILKLSSTLLPVKIILALYSDYDDNAEDNIIAASLQFIHVSSEKEASKALLEYWNTHVITVCCGDSPEMNLTLMATIIQYYSGILNTTYDNHCFEVIGTEVTCQGVVTDTVNCAIIQVSDAEIRYPFAVPDVFCSRQAELEAQCLNKFFSFCSMTSLEIITMYEKDFIIPLFEDKHQFPQEFVREFGHYDKVECLKLTAVETIWVEKIGLVSEYSSGKVMLEQLGMDDEAMKEYYYDLCMEVASSDYFSVMISNPVFAEIVTALKTTWNHKQVQEFTNSMSERLNMCSEEEKESYSRWRESGKTLGVSTAALINKLIITPIQENEEFEIVRLKDETARDTKSSISHFNLQQPKCVEALYKFVKGLRVEKTTKDALKSELEQYTLSKDSGGVITFTPVIDVSALPESVIAEAESEKNETFNLNALGLRGILRLYNSKLYLMGTSLTAFAMMCVICARRDKKGSYQRVGEMGEKYLASLRQKKVNWLKDKYTRGKIKPEACGALYSMVIRPFWELHADEAKRNVRHNLLTVKCWRYMNIMAVMHLTMYNDVKLPILQMKTLQCRNFSVLPSMLVRVSDQVKARHCVVCKRCGNYNFRGATLMDVCIMCMYGEHLFFKCKTAKEKKEEATNSKKLMLRNCIRESNTRANFNGEMYCKKCCSYDDCTGGDDEGLKKHTVSFLVCEKCCCTYALSNEKDLKRTAVCFVCIFVDTLKQKFQNGQKDLESFLSDLSNPTVMVIQMGIIMACEEGNARLTDQCNFWSWLKETMESRHQTTPSMTESMGQQSHKLSENMLKKVCGMKMTGDQKLCGMKISGDREKYQVIQSRDATQNPDVAVPITPRLPRRQKKMTKARRRREYKGRQKILPVKERMEYIDKRREKRKKRRDIIAEKQAQAKELMQSSSHEDLLRRVREAFTRTCHKCRMSVVCSPESMWEGCLICDGLVDPATSSHFQQVNKPLSDVVPLQLLNSLVLGDVGVKLSADSWKDLKKVSSIGQFFRFVEIVSSDDAGENEAKDVDDREKILQDNNEEAVVDDDDDKKNTTGESKFLWQPIQL